MDIIGVQGMTKFQNPGIVATILILISVVYSCIDGPSLTLNSENYRSVTFDSLSEQDMDTIVAVKNEMKVAAQ